MREFDWLKEVAQLFDVRGDFIYGALYGDGLINRTYVIENKVGATIVRYIIQRINDTVFSEIDGLINNIQNVCEFYAKRTNQSYLRSEQSNTIKNCRSLNLIKTKKGANYAFFDGGYYRVYDFIEGARTYSVAENDRQMFESGRVCGQFHTIMKEFDASTLVETIKDFHNTPKRYENFKDAVKYDKLYRNKIAEAEIEDAFLLENKTSTIIDGIKSKDLPLIVTHNDTKLNNVMIDENGIGVCLIDFDTIMSGSFLYDYGDAIRSGCNSAVENERNIDKVEFRKDMYDAYYAGYLSEVKLNKTEKELLPFSAYLMTYECGIRFLTDFLQGDIYFKTTFDKENLIRARNQLKLAHSIKELFKL
ncbi:MAG: phosphotransferase [Clostridia bacterium]